MSQIPNQTFATKLFFFQPVKAIRSTPKKIRGFPGVAQLWGSHTDRADLTGTHTPGFRVLNLLTVTSSHAIFPPFSSPAVLRRRKPISSHSQTWSLLFVCEVFPYHLSKLVPIPQPALTLCHATFASLSSPTITHFQLLIFFSQFQNTPRKWKTEEDRPLFILLLPSLSQALCLGEIQS